MSDDKEKQQPKDTLPKIGSDKISKGNASENFVGDSQKEIGNTRGAEVQLRPTTPPKKSDSGEK